MIARLIRILRWIFANPPTCSRSECTEFSLCDECTAFWVIK